MTKPAMVVLALLALNGTREAPPHTARAAPERIVANANREPAGRLEGGVLTLNLEVRRGLWYPETDSGASIAVLAFGEAGKPLSIPGPMIRVPAGTTLRVTVTNTLADTTLFLRGMQTHPSADAPTALAPGASRNFSFRVGAPGTYYYWAGITNDSSDVRDDTDSQLAGAFVVDAGAAPANDRVFVITNWFQPRPAQELMAINGKSWPETERLAYTVGDSVHWRWINATTNSHPMHLHGFYYRVEADGSYLGQHRNARGLEPLVVTHLMLPASTMQIGWRAERAGNWIFHCHFAFHTSPFLAMDTMAAMHQHRMAGLVLGITVRPGPAVAAAGPSPGARAIRLLVQSVPNAFGSFPGMGYVMRLGAEPAADSIMIPGPLLLLRRGEPVAITIVNRLKEPTAVHWHGIELQSPSDGVPNWSGAPGNVMPPIAPGDSFTARFTPPRAGTFIYHTHFNERTQMRSGLYGPLIVMPEGEAFDSTRDKVILLSARGPDDSTFCCGAPPLVNGHGNPRPLRLTTGVTYRLRIINIHPDWRVRFRLMDEGGAVAWTPVAKDGADLPAGARVPNTHPLLTGAGETADYTVRFLRPGVRRLEIATNSAGWFVPVELIVTRP